MGTKRSRHNKGRKPLYKEHGSDSARNFVERVERIANEATALPFRRQSKSSPNPELAGRVVAYLADLKAKREANVAEAEAKIARTRSPQIDVERASFDIPLRDCVLVSAKDICLQLFVEKRIGANQLLAARLWLHYLEESTLQSCSSIDPGTPLNSSSWQKRGELTEAQYRALIIRKIASLALGKIKTRFLDAILQPDVDRSSALRMFRAPWDKIQYELIYCLDALSICFGKDTGFPTDGMDVFRSAAIKAQDYRLAWSKEMYGDAYNEHQNYRRIMYEDAKAHAVAV